LENGLDNPYSQAGDVNDPGNWRHITLSSVIFRIIFGRLAQVMTSNENYSVRRGILSLSQKGFVPRVNGCGEHIAIANKAINRAMTTPKVLYMMVLDMCDAFGSVSHVQLGNNLSKLGLHHMLTG
jgi:hypothetical protein